MVDILLSYGNSQKLGTYCDVACPFTLTVQVAFPFILHLLCKDGVLSIAALSSIDPLFFFCH